LKVEIRYSRLLRCFLLWAGVWSRRFCRSIAIFSIYRRKRWIAGNEVLHEVKIFVSVCIVIAPDFWQIAQNDELQVWVSAIVHHFAGHHAVQRAPAVCYVQSMVYQSTPCTKDQQKW